MSETSDVASTDNVNVVFREVHFLCVLKFFHEDLVVVAQTETCEVVSSEEEDLVCREGGHLYYLLS